MEEGTLAFTGGATIGVNPNNATIVRVSEGASLALSGGTVNLHAQLNGAGTVTIGTADTAGLVNISNTGNTNFTGRLELVGNGVNMNTNANWVAFGAGNTLGGGTVFIDGKGFHFPRARRQPILKSAQPTARCRTALPAPHILLRKPFRFGHVGHGCERADEQCPHGIPQGLLGNSGHQ